ncbi:hypothetical protein Vretimale_19687, partial [Volvox reticuliferus]
MHNNSDINYDWNAFNLPPRAGPALQHLASSVSGAVGTSILHSPQQRPVVDWRAALAASQAARISRDQCLAVQPLGHFFAAESLGAQHRLGQQTCATTGTDLVSPLHIDTQALSNPKLPSIRGINTPHYLSRSVEPPSPLQLGEAQLPGAQVPAPTGEAIQNHCERTSCSSKSTAGCDGDNHGTLGKSLSAHPANDAPPLRQRNSKPSPITPPSMSAPAATAAMVTATAGSPQADRGTQTDGSSHQSHTADSGRPWNSIPHSRRSYTVLYVRDYGPEDRNRLELETAVGQTRKHGLVPEGRNNDLAAHAGASVSGGAGSTVSINGLKRHPETEPKQEVPLSPAG